MVRNSNKLCQLRLVMNIQPFMVSWTLAASKMGLVLGPPKPSTKGDLYKQQDQPFLSSPRSLYFVAAFQRLEQFMYPTHFSGSHYWRVQFLLSIFCVSWVVVFLSDQNCIETFWERGTTKNKHRFHPKLHGYLAGGSATHLKNMLVKLDHCPKFLGFWGKNDPSKKSNQPRVVGYNDASSPPVRNRTAEFTLLASGVVQAIFISCNMGHCLIVDGETWGPYKWLEMNEFHRWFWTPIKGFHLQPSPHGLLWVVVGLRVVYGLWCEWRWRRFFWIPP